MSEDFEEYFKKIKEENAIRNAKNLKGRKSKNNSGVELPNIIMAVAAALIGGGILISILYFGIKAINIKQRVFVNRSNYAYKKIQKELTAFYKKNNYVYKSKDARVDEFCMELGNKLSAKAPDCLYIGGVPKTNFVLKGKRIEIIGMEQPAFERMGTLVKDIMIDINGSGKGSDEIGIDRVPVRIYSSGRMGGLLSPVNCSHQDFLDFDIEYAAICHNGPEIDFMATKIPFGYDIYQMGGDKGRTTPINRDIPYLRADCTAFGGDLAMLDDYCERRGYPWIPACYDEYECSILISKKKMYNSGTSVSANTEVKN